MKGENSMVQSIFGAISKAIHAAQAAQAQKANSGQSEELAGQSVQPKADAFGSGNASVTQIFDDSGKKIGYTRTSPDGETDTTMLDPTTGGKVSRVVKNGDTMIMSIDYDPATGAKTREDDYKNGVLATTTIVDPKTGNTIQEDNYDLSGGISRSTTIDPNSGYSTATDFNYQGQKTESLTYDKDGHLIQNVQLDPTTGNKKSSTLFDDKGTITEVDNFDPATGNPTDATKFDPATGKPTRAEKYTSDGKLLAMAIYDSTGSFDETIYDTDTGEVLTKCSNSGGDPFSNCDPASIARLKQKEAELKQMQADMDAAIQAQKDAAAKDKNKDDSSLPQE